MAKKTKVKSGFKLGKFIQDMSSMGTHYNDLVKSTGQVKVTSKVQDPVSGEESTEYDIFTNMSNQGFTNKTADSILNEDYKTRRSRCRKYANENEIDDVLDKVTDEAIVYNNTNHFLKPVLNQSQLVKKGIHEELSKKLDSNFKNIYELFGFNDENTAWAIFKKFLIDGALAFEIIYDDLSKPTKIIGFRELDPAILQATSDKEGNLVWLEKKDRNSYHNAKFYYDSQIIYISYNTKKINSKISYTERLIKPFNLLSIMERSRINWAITNSQMRTKFIIPVAGKTKTRAKESLQKMIQRYKEDVEFNTDTGEIKIDGSSNLPFRKEYWMPETSSGTPTIETMPNDTVDLSDMKQVKHFFDKFIQVSKVPPSRFEEQNQPSWSAEAENIKRSEISFGRFIDRLRSQFQVLITKPLWFSLTLEKPEIKDDSNVKNMLGVKFQKYNVFEELKDIELKKKKVDFISQMFEDLSYEDEDRNTIHYFDLEFLIKEYLGLSDDQIKRNQEMKDKDASDEDAGDDADGGDDGFGF